MVLLIKAPNGLKPDKDRSPFKVGKGETFGVPLAPVYARRVRKNGLPGTPPIKLLGHASNYSEASGVAGGAVYWHKGAYYAYATRRV